MIIYRPHRGGLEESMAEAKEFENELEMKKYIHQQWHEMFNNKIELFSIDDIVIDEHEMNDDRTGWEDTKHVCLKRLGNDDYILKYGTPQCIGMCATRYPNLEESNNKILK